MALKTMFATLKKENAKNSFGNIIAVANESAEIRDTFMEEMDTPIEVDLNDPDAEEKFKDEALNSEDMDELIDSIPETEIDDASVAVGKLTNQNIPVNPDEYIGAPMEESMLDIDVFVPDTEEE